jgi:hypothetical protein
MKRIIQTGSLRYVVAKNSFEEKASPKDKSLFFLKLDTAF